MLDDPLIRLGLLGVLLIFSAFFSGSETALLALDKLRVKYLVQKKRPGALKLEAVLAEPDRLLSGILVGNNLVNIAASVFATGLFVQYYGERGEWLTIAVLTPMLLIFSEICPKTYAAKHPEKISFLVLRPIRGVLWLLTPVIWLTTGFSRLFSHLLGGGAEIGRILSEDEIRSIITVGEESGVVASEQRRMLHSILDLSGTRVREVMIPRTEVVGLEVDTPYEQVVQQVREARHSRFPVYDKTLDQVVGIIHSKDILSTDPGAPVSLRQVLRPPYFVPETKQIGHLLQTFRRRRVHLAIVLDEYGGMAGVVTLEDILEEIVGDIQDEYDADEVVYHRLGESLYRVDAGTSLRSINRRFGLNLTEEHASTLAGFLLQLFDTIPAVGDSCRFQGIVFAVCRMTDRRIDEVEMDLSGFVPPVTSEGREG